VVELGDDFVLPRPAGDFAGVPVDYDLSYLPVTPVDDRLDLLAGVVFVGKAVMKGIFRSKQ